MDKTIGFIGSGALASAMIGGIVKSGSPKAQKVMASDCSVEKLKQLEEMYAIQTTTDNQVVARFADILFLTVKPNLYAEVIAQIRDDVKQDGIIVTPALGQTLANVRRLFGKDMKILRTMPNTPALVGEAMSALSPNEWISAGEMQELQAIFESFGKAEIISESLMDIVPGVSGSSPAYVFMFIEAMADAAVSEGMPRSQAYQFSAQAVLGAAKMVLETNLHPGQLKDQVCSPNGSTIAAICELERTGFRHAVISAVKACTQKART